MHIGKVVKNSTNPHFKKSYADINALLDTVEPILHENGLLLLQPINDKVLKTQIIDIDSGQMIESWLTLPDNIDPQKMISATTYYRRATLQSLLALQAVDDDGNSVAATQKPTLTNDRFNEALKSIASGKYSLEKLRADFNLTKEQIEKL
ncbi:MAG: ERF family protein, partial [Candidatus Paceibacterota bacterium]